MKCLGEGCTRTLISSFRWKAMSPDERRESEARGVFPNKARGLCAPCYHQAVRTGAIVDFERFTRPVEDVIEDWLLLRSEGFTRLQAAERLGMKPKSFDKALTRAVKRGLLEHRDSLPMRRSKFHTTREGTNGNRIDDAA